MAEPGIDKIVAEDLAAVRDAKTAVENGVGQDDHLDGWGEAFRAARRLEDAAGRLAETIRRELRAREVKEEITRG